MLEITSSQNPKFKLAKSLKERKERDATGLFLIEGYREVTRAFAGGVAPTYLFLCPELFLPVRHSVLDDRFLDLHLLLG